MSQSSSPGHENDETDRAPGGLAAEGNPFSTRHVRPGAIDYVFGGEANAEALVATLRENQWRGEIVGPHGSGKSTLLATLLPMLEQAGRKIVRFSLHGGERRLPASSAESKSWDADTQVVVDGYERLGWWSRRWLDLTCRSRKSGLLVTAHASVGLPTLHQSGISLDVLQAIVARLLASGPPLISPADVAHVFEQQGGNARETLFALYDLYEQRRR